MRTESLSIDVDGQQVGFVPAPLLQQAQLFGAAFNRLAADAAARDPSGLGHCRQHVLILASRHAAQQSAHHALGGSPILLQSFVGRHRDLALRLMVQTGPPYFDLAVGERDPVTLRFMPADVAARFAGTAAPRLLPARSEAERSRWFAARWCGSLHSRRPGLGCVNEGQPVRDSNFVVASNRTVSQQMHP